MKDIIGMEEYKLYGFLNMFGLIPDFIFPIFEWKNILYIQEGENDKLDAIVPLKEELHDRVITINEYSDIQYLVKCRNIFVMLGTIKSLPMYAFQNTKDTVVYGDSKRLLEYLDTFDTCDDILKQEISDFRDDIKDVNVFTSKNETEIARLYREIEKYELDMNDVDKNCTPNILFKRGNKPLITFEDEIEISYFYGAGKGKHSVAKVYLKYGTGKIQINERDINVYFRQNKLKDIIKKPLKLTNNVGKFDIIVYVYGGEHIDQAEAIKNGISIALLKVNIGYIKQLKKAGCLTENSSIIEKKKYGLKSTRRVPWLDRR